MAQCAAGDVVAPKGEAPSAELRARYRDLLRASSAATNELALQASRLEARVASEGYLFPSAQASALVTDLAGTRMMLNEAVARGLDRDESAGGEDDGQPVASGPRTGVVAHRLAAFSRALRGLKASDKVRGSVEAWKPSCEGGGEVRAPCPPLTHAAAHAGLFPRRHRGRGAEGGAGGSAGGGGRGRCRAARHGALVRVAEAQEGEEGWQEESGRGGYEAPCPGASQRGGVAPFGVLAGVHPCPSAAPDAGGAGPTLSQRACPATTCRWRWSTSSSTTRRSRRRTCADRRRAPGEGGRDSHLTFRPRAPQEELRGKSKKGKQGGEKGETSLFNTFGL